MAVSASQLYDYVTCPHRVHLDQFGDASKRDAVSPFVRLLWERGTAYEAKVIAGLPEAEFLSVRDLPIETREEYTRKAIAEGVQLIYGGRLSVDDLVGEPDLLILRDGQYLPADIKAGQGETGDGDDGDGKPKAHYAVQLALYADILERMGIGAGHSGEIWDINGDHVPYDLDRPRHSKTTETWWDVYQHALAAVREIGNGSATRGALASVCKLCPWHTHCREELVATFDLSLVPSLGRAIRDSMSGHIADLKQFASTDPETLIDGKKTAIPGLGIDRLRLFHSRAVMLCDSGAKPYLRDVVSLPSTEVEIFFDIEADPMNDIVYLHGFVERSASGETFTYFFAEHCDAAAERDAFAQAMEWLREREGAAIYYYSKYERTMYRKLCERHPGVTSDDEIEALFTQPRSIDLYYDVVYRATEWPTYDHSIKTLAKYLGFGWRDTDPSGASSIEWYQRWLESRDPALRQRIIEYNQDDCRATAVLLDGIRTLALAVD